MVREWIHRDQAVETDFDGPLVEAMAAALRAEDPAALPVPYTDARGHGREVLRAARACAASASRRCCCRPDLDFAAMFHGIDERVPTEGLRFGVRVLDRFLASS